MCVCIFDSTDHIETLLANVKLNNNSTQNARVHKFALISSSVPSATVLFAVVIAFFFLHFLLSFIVQISLFLFVALF